VTRLRLNIVILVNIYVFASITISISIIFYQICEKQLYSYWFLLLVLHNEVAYFKFLILIVILLV